METTIILTNIVTIINTLIILSLINRCSKLEENVIMLHLSMSAQLLDELLFGEENNDNDDEV